MDRARDLVPSVALQGSEKCDDVRFLGRRELRFEHEIEELDGVFECQQPAVVEIRRRIFDAPQREGLDRSVGAGSAAVDHAFGEEALSAQIVHREIGVIRRRVTGRALCFAEEQLLATHLRLAGFARVEFAINAELRHGRKSSSSGIPPCHAPGCRAAGYAFLGRDDRVTIEVCTRCSNSVKSSTLLRRARNQKAAGYSLTQARRVETMPMLCGDATNEMRQAVAGHWVAVKQAAAVRHQAAVAGHVELLLREWRNAAATSVALDLMRRRSP